MEIGYTAVLAIAAFILGSVPFSVVIGRWLLKKDITKYGDNNPGSANVFRAGGPAIGMLAAVLDVSKGVPFVLLSHIIELPVLSPVIVAVCAVLGHAFSPFLHWHGGKAVAVTFGVMLGLLPQYDILLVFIIFMIACSLLVKSDSWGVIISAVGTLAYLIAFNGYSWKPLLMLCLLAILVIKHFEDLHTLPSLRGRLVRRLQAR
ncbi:MAG: glycerol-3-phosphate acyltransferase [Dehalococcoidales bacterium]